MKELDKVLDPNEKVLWEGSPKFWPFFLGSSVLTTVFGIFWLFFVAIFIAMAWQAPGPSKYFILAMPHLWVGLLMLFGPPIYTLMVFSKTYYAITDKRVILQRGVVGRDFQMIDFDQMTNAEVNIGVFDKLFGNGSGSILMASAGTFSEGKGGVVSRPYMIANVDKPYDVFKFLKKVSHDVKTDIEYPNQMRPSENPGYPSKYTPDNK